MEFVIHPGVYKTGNSNGLRTLLEEIWVRQHTPGEGQIYIISGFSNFNGGARFYKTFKEHIECGGEITVLLGGSSSQRLSSRQVVEALLDCGARVFVINRKRLLHAKTYGVKTADKQLAVVSSGNFTGPGLSQNIEASTFLNNEDLLKTDFDWDQVFQSIRSQNWQIHECVLDEPEAAFWGLLYDESPDKITIDESEEQTLVITLQPTDTNRILASRGQSAGLGSQYFWLSKDCFDFFPPLNITNARGWKGTLSAMVTINYVDLGKVRQERVTFEAENNLDFRLGTGLLRYTKLAAPDDLACITRISEDQYELRIIKRADDRYKALEKYAINFIGNKGKRYGYIDNGLFHSLI